MQEITKCETSPEWLQGYIPTIDKRNHHLCPKTAQAIEQAKAARERYLAAAERARKLTA